MKVPDTNTSRIVLLIAALFVASLPSQVAAVSQEISVTINPDMTATGTWMLPVPAGSYSFEEFQNFGSTGVMSYHIDSMSQGSNPISFIRTPEGATVHNPYANSSTAYVAPLSVNYTIRTGLQRPVAIYEFWVAGGAYFNSPTMTINFPKGWKVLSTWPQAATTSATAISIKYPTETSYVRPVLVMIAPADTASQTTAVREGRFTILGSQSDVAKLRQVVQKLGFLDTLFQRAVGADAPGELTLYAADLSNVNVGYEATALAAKPGLILYNSDLLAKQSLGEAAIVLVHEIAHIYELNENLFLGATFIAPWFHEGFAVFLENQARSLVFADHKEELVADLMGNMHLLTAAELKEGYQHPFDYFFDGEAAQSLSDSYSFAGVVLKVFYDKVAATGMKSLFGKLKSSYSNQVIQIRDSETILSTMTGVSGIESDALLHPGKNAQSFAQATAGLVRPDYGAEGDAILADYILHQIPSYIVGDDGAPVPSVSTAAPAGLAATSSTAVKNQKAGNCPILSRNLARGAKGADVRSLQEYLISLGLLANDSATGTFGPLTAKTLQIWQKGKGLPATGTVGPMTRAEIAKSCGK